MQLISAEFVTSAARPDQFLTRPIPHFVFAGKSNVGKSALLNALLRRKHLAMTSRTPGKTRLVNYFLINDRFFFVDLPGYGYAKVSKKERQAWKTLVEAYLSDSPFIATVFQLIDIRHPPGAHDREMLDWLRHFRFPFRVLLTKADKCSRQQVQKNHLMIARTLDMDPSEVIATSATKGVGLVPTWNHIDSTYQIATREINAMKESP